MSNQIELLGILGLSAEKSARRAEVTQLQWAGRDLALLYEKV